MYTNFTFPQDFIIFYLQKYLFQYLRTSYILLPGHGMGHGDQKGEILPRLPGGIGGIGCMGSLFFSSWSHMAYHGMLIFFLENEWWKLDDKNCRTTHWTYWICRVYWNQLLKSTFQPPFSWASHLNRSKELVPPSPKYQAFRGKCWCSLVLQLLLSPDLSCWGPTHCEHKKPRVGRSVDFGILVILGPKRLQLQQQFMMWKTSPKTRRTDTSLTIDCKSH